MYNVMQSINDLLFMTMTENGMSLNKSVDFSEIDKLEKGLQEKNIPYDRHRLFDGWQIECDGWDAICHRGSYGGTDGLLEIMGDIVENDDDDVEGYLRAKDILSRL